VAEPKPGSGYRALRVTGTLVMFIGAGILTFFLIVAGATWLVEGSTSDSDARIAVIIALAASAGIALLGYGLFWSSRFAEPPPGARNEPPAR
jgi:hypothetical protein